MSVVPQHIESSGTSRLSPSAPTAQEASATAGAGHRLPHAAELFNDDHLSLLRFQGHVLDEAGDLRNPPLERVRFAAIAGNNIDEFLMVRAIEARREPGKRLVIDQTVRRLLRTAYARVRRSVEPALASHGIHLLRLSHLSDEERRRVVRDAAPALARVAVNDWRAPGPFPDVPGLGLNFLVRLSDEHESPRYAVVRVPDGVAAALPIDAPPGTQRRYVWLHDLVRAQVPRLLAGTTIRGVHAFRIVRAAEGRGIEGDPEAKALHTVRSRPVNEPVALFIERTTPRPVIAALTAALGLDACDVQAMPWVVDFHRYWEITRLPRPELQYRPFEPRVAPGLERGCDVFAAIRRNDILLHHPYDSFEPVLDFVRQAAADPAVESISASIYRTDRESPFVHALADAARRGKQVHAVVELKARFDEERNVAWSRLLRDAGARVSHLPDQVKAHAKVTLVVRREGAERRRYGHVSSGNYNAFTARAYTDVGMFTCDPAITADLDLLFAALTGTSGRSPMRALLAAPAALRGAFRALVEREIDHAGSGGRGHLILKMNGLHDREVIRLLYRASQSGVRVDLIVRGACALRPGVAGISDHIHVRSIVGRFLEHSRAWYFRNGGAEEVYIGSADLMPRNLDRRVDVMTPVLDPILARRIRDQILFLQLADTANARVLSADGSYVRVRPEADRPAVDAQASLVEPGMR